MKLGTRARVPGDSQLCAVVFEALTPTHLARLAHPEDWPDPPGNPFGEELPRALWNRALGEIVEDILTRPSGRFRARLAELAFRLSDGHGDPPVALGALLEVLHAGSLIIDDIEDGSPERRGQAAMHVRYGLPSALNAGNWMYIRALQLVEAVEPELASVRDRLRRAVVDAMASCHLGQAVDLTLRVAHLPRAAVYRVVASSTMLKTGALMELAARLGAITAGAGAPREEALARFGRRMGLGLQMLDDFRNLAVHGGSAGKKALEDLRNGSPTWPWAIASRVLDEAGFDELQRSARDVLERGEAAEGRARAVAAALLMAVGRHGREQISRHLAEALADLRAAVGPRPELAAVEAELQRLEESYG